jgi:CO/xanthine dehydrogenase Mo-binding subunit
VAHDCGLVINPGGLKLCIEGNVVQSISRTLWEEVNFTPENVASVDWASYPILEAADAPEAVDIVLLGSQSAPASGAGESTMRVVAAAINNAVFEATGIRFRRAPLSPSRIKAGIA